jgi:hypothetical protein
VSAPSSLAVTLARDANMTLAGFVRGGGYNLYTGGARLTRPAAPVRTGEGPLAFIPTTVRTALDAIARKISLVDWQALTFAERERLVTLAEVGPMADFAAELTASVVARTGREPRVLPVQAKDRG